MIIKETEKDIETIKALEKMLKEHEERIRILESYAEGEGYEEKL